MAAALKRVGTGAFRPDPPAPAFVNGNAGCHYRIEVFGEARSPWRPSPAEAMEDAICLGLASWDEGAHEYYLAVPVDMAVRFDGRAGHARCGR